MFKGYIPVSMLSPFGGSLKRRSKGTGKNSFSPLAGSQQYTLVRSTRGKHDSPKPYGLSVSWTCFPTGQWLS